MWLTSDGRANVVALPDGSQSMAALKAYLLGLSEVQVRSLDEELESLQWRIADALTELSFDAGVEERFVARPLPEQIMEALNWERLLGANKKSEFDQTDIRWRLDVLGVVQQAIAEIAAPS